MKFENQNRTCIILGMHRSGTSLLARWLQKCGLDIGDNLLQGDKFSNKDGHFEDVDFLKFHQEVLVRNNIPSSGLFSEDVEINISNNERDKLIEIIQKKSIKDQWGWKDPRTILLIKYYFQYLPNAFFLIIIRNPDSVTGSLYKREMRLVKNRFKNGEISIIQFARIMYYLIKSKKRVLEKYLDIWKMYNVELLAFIQTNYNKKYLVIDYNDLLKVDKGIISTLKCEGFNLNYFPLKELFNQKNFPKKYFKKNDAFFLYKKLLRYKIKSFN